MRAALYLPPQDTTDRETLGNLLQEGTQVHRVCRIHYTLLHFLVCCTAVPAIQHLGVLVHRDVVCSPQDDTDQDTDGYLLMEVP